MGHQLVLIITIQVNLLQQLPGTNKAQLIRQIKILSTAEGKEIEVMYHSSIPTKWINLN